MAISYSAAKAQYAADHQVFGSNDAVVIKDTSSWSSVVAVAVDLTTAEAIAAALNGGS
ncbi:hypothetical protein [Mycolicibacterium fortuitum]|uniref:Uncharacterized protein n=1 Tax=Mycolicibacterium fortuitum TaxID=1766 RepID=A0AAE4V6K5_MYCFO|nr:hypothetical protein [Mycolicibacterium fortuitum]MDV7194613.1 hypothetical protein [Mycolicibacterium fortuitum]MDV7208613.1 hypothetical protein [Mycolicibacterium fortuitum]MDV7230510.1 hypothetical protein [Mycolicibacterium fortuitum]MDV7261883.1 hypothetical protein [Mycolicibacterium fortuitum]MDV7287008.1 hypothetical protein [Mycolicibacterium fortuitum]